MRYSLGAAQISHLPVLAARITEIAKLSCVGRSDAPQDVKLCTLCALTHSLFPTRLTSQAYHIYCFNTTSIFLEPVCRIAFDLAWGAAKRDVARLGAGFMTEFGAVGEDRVSLTLLRWMVQFAEEYGQSWTYWQFKDFHDITTAFGAWPWGESFYHLDGSLQEEKVKLLTRPYAPKVAGFTVSQKYEESGNGRKFTLVFEASSAGASEHRCVSYDSPVGTPRFNIVYPLQLNRHWQLRLERPKFSLPRHISRME